MPQGSQAMDPRNINRQDSGGAAGFAAAAAAIAAAAAAAAAAEPHATDEQTAAAAAAAARTGGMSADAAAHAAAAARAVQQAIAMQTMQMHMANVGSQAAGVQPACRRPPAGLQPPPNIPAPGLPGHAEWQRVLELVSEEQREQMLRSGAAMAANSPGEQLSLAQLAAARMAAWASGASPQPHPEGGCGGCGAASGAEGGGSRPSAGAALRSSMGVAARNKQFGEAHRMLEQLWSSDESYLVEPRLLLWAAQRRTSGARLWWGHIERERSSAMLRRALSSGTATAGALDEASTRKAFALLETLRVAGELHAANEPAAREMQSLQSHLTSWMDQRLATADPILWERPAAASSSLPQHVRKMARRYDALRAALLRAARGETTPPASGGALAAVLEGEEGEEEEARGVVAAAPAAASVARGPSRAEEEPEEEELSPRSWAGISRAAQHGMVSPRFDDYEETPAASPPLRRSHGDHASLHA